MFPSREERDASLLRCDELVEQMRGIMQTVINEQQMYEHCLMLLTSEVMVFMPEQGENDHWTDMVRRANALADMFGSTFE